MSAIRPFAESDLSAVGGLHRRLYPGNPFPGEELQSYFRRIFFREPVVRPGVPVAGFGGLGRPREIAPCLTDDQHRELRPLTCEELRQLDPRV